MRECRFIEPLDAIFLRGNRLFGEGSAPGDAAMPPWPSVFAGAIRSWMLVAAGVSPKAYGGGKAQLPGEIDDVLGTPAAPGSFSICDAGLGRIKDGQPEWLRPCPADLKVSTAADGQLEVRRLRVFPQPAWLGTSFHLPALPVLPGDSRAKPVSGWWLTPSGWSRYLRGDEPAPGDFVHREALWSLERRVGIELDGARRSAASGKLYSTDAIHLARHPQTGFLVEIGGAPDFVLPGDGAVLRLGGDGRPARVSRVSALRPARPDLEQIATSGEFRLVLTSPGMFPEGWRLPGLDQEGTWHLPGGRARLVSAAVGRYEVVSGWDLARGLPKPARRVAPTGSVYWFDRFEGDVQSLGNLAESGLWFAGDDNQDGARRAEGFNRCVVANA